MSNELFSREQALSGLTASRARTLLFLIESRTAHLVARTAQLVTPLPSAATLHERDLAFVQAFSLGRQPPLKPTIQDLEHYASQWAYLAPDSPPLRAALAYFVGTKYRFTRAAIPAIRSVLGLDSADVRAAYEQAYSRPLDAIYRGPTTLGERLRWRWAALTGWLEALPPFWIAFAVSIPLGGTTLALPIAVADIGPLPAVALLVLLGLVNVLTIAALAEAVVRHGAIRYGNIFFGRVVQDYVGRAGSFLLSLALAGFSFGLLLVFYMGISSTLANATSIQAEVWSLLILLVGIYFLSRGSLNTTIGSMMLVGAVNTVLLLVLSLLAVSGWHRDNVLYVNVPFLNGRPFDPGILGLIFGVVLGTFFAHMSVGNFAPLLLRRDPTGRSMIWGHSAGVVFMIVLASIWVLAVNGALEPQVLTAETGTALAPLAAHFGPIVQVLGSIFVILSMGMGSIFFSLSLFNLARERLSAVPNAWGRFMLSASPVILVCLIAIGLSLTGGGSFAGLLGLLGVATSTLAAGIFPVLLLLVARRKGERVPGRVYRILGNPLLTGAVYVLFLAGLLVHGLVIWTGPVERAGALLIALWTVVTTVAMIRQGVFAPRLVVELCEDDENKTGSNFSLVVGGKPSPADVRLVYPEGEQNCQAASGALARFDRLRQAEFHWPALPVRELVVWAHRITPEGESNDLPAIVTVQSNGNDVKQFESRSPGGRVIVPLGVNPTALSVCVELSAGVDQAPPGRSAE